jgi:hypothetical protein
LVRQIQNQWQAGTKSFGKNRAAAVNYVEKARTLRRSGEDIVAETAKRRELTIPRLGVLGGSVTFIDLCDDCLKHVQDPFCVRQLLDDLQVRTFLRQPRAKRMPEVMPSEVINLGILQRLSPPLLFSPVELPDSKIPKCSRLIGLAPTGEPLPVRRSSG